MLDLRDDKHNHIRLGCAQMQSYCDQEQREYYLQKSSVSSVIKRTIAAYNVKKYRISTTKIVYVYLYEIIARYSYLYTACSYLGFSMYNLQKDLCMDTSLSG